MLVSGIECGRAHAVGLSRDAARTLGTAQLVALLVAEPSFEDEAFHDAGEIVCLPSAGLDADFDRSLPLVCDFRLGEGPVQKVAPKGICAAQGTHMQRSVALDPFKAHMKPGILGRHEGQTGSLPRRGLLVAGGLGFLGNVGVGGLVLGGCVGVCGCSLGVGCRLCALIRSRLRRIVRCGCIRG